MKALRYFFLLVICVSCIDPYMPPVSSEQASFLVVDGYISIDGTANVKLSRSIPLSLSTEFPKEKNATVSIKSSSGEVFTLTETDSATYAASNLDVSFDEKYTLSVRTANGSEYTSDEVQPYTTPPIDDVIITVPEKRDLLEIRLSSTDPNPNATGYYLWDAVETYQYHAPVFAGWKRVNGEPVERDPSEVLYTCWRDAIRPSVMFSTKPLSENVISRFAVARVEKGSEKLSMRYSILLKQRAISEGEYAFRTQLQKTSEQQGGIFAVMPGAVVGNVNSKNSKEFVLGYFRAQQVTEKRFFINFLDLPEDFQILQTLPPGCSPIRTCPVPTPPSYFDCTPLEQLGNDVLITTAITNDRGGIIGYYYVVTACGDCRYKGGYVERPPFW